MAAHHWLTNRGKLILMQGGWDDSGAGIFKFGLLAGVSGTPAAIDTAAEVADLDTVAGLLTGGIVEPTVGGYARQTLSRTNATEDDTNDRVNMDASDVTFTAVLTGETTYGFFWYDSTTDTNDTTRLLMGVGEWTTAIPFNGSNVVCTITDLIRAS